MLSGVELFSANTHLDLMRAEMGLKETKYESLNGFPLSGGPAVKWVLKETEGNHPYFLGSPTVAYILIGVGLCWGNPGFLVYYAPFKQPSTQRKRISKKGSVSANLQGQISPFCMGAFPKWKSAPPPSLCHGHLQTQPLKINAPNEGGCKIDPMCPSYPPPPPRKTYGNGVLLVCCHCAIKVKGKR